MSTGSWQVDHTSDPFASWLATHPDISTAWDRRIIEDEPMPADTSDPGGRNADRAAAASWFAQLEETPGRWAS